MSGTMSLMDKPITTSDLEFWQNYFAWQQTLLQADLQGANFTLELVDNKTGQRQKFSHVRFVPSLPKRN